MKMKLVKNSLRTKLLLAFTALGILSMFILGGVIADGQQKLAFEQVNQNLQINLQQLCQEMNQTLRQVLQVEADEDMMRAILERLPFVVNAAQTPNGDPLEIQRTYQDTVFYLQLDEAYLCQFFSSNTDVMQVSIVSASSREAGAVSQRALDQFIVRAPLFDADIVVVQYFDSRNLLGNAAFWNELTIRVGLISVIISICAACVISYRISDGVNQLVEEIKRMRKGDFTDGPAPKGEDEIALLTRSFRTMKAELDTMVNRTLKLKISEREARIKALQSQISPHFLYNALDSINWSLLEKGDWESSAILIALSSVLRYSIDDSKEMVFLEEEIEQVKNYLVIQQSRFADRFSYTIEVEEPLNKVMVPKMLLQPLAENAIQHGLEQGKDGVLEIKAFACPEGLTITVMDTGCGIPSEQLRALQEQLKENDQIEDEEGFHLGLANVNSRLKYIFGRKSGLQIESQEGQYTKMILLLDLGMI